MPKKMEINGVAVQNGRHEQNSLTLVDQKEASSNLPSELYAEGVAAYLGSPESRRELQQQSPEVHAFVEQAMNEFLIAGPR